MNHDFDGDNDTIVAVAAAVAKAANPLVTSFVRDAVLKGTWKTLLTEGKELPLRAPGAGELEVFFAHQRDLVAKVGQDAERAQLLAALDAAQANTGASLKAPVFYTWQHVADLTSYTLSRGHHTDRLVIAIDLDGCLYDFNSTMRAWLVSRGWDAAQLIDPTEYHLQAQWGIDASVFEQEMVVSLGDNVMFRTGAAFSDAVRGARALGEAGHVLLANSARQFPGHEHTSRAATLQWLREHGIHPDQVHLSDPYDPADKLSVPFDLLVDDHPGNVEAALDAGRAAVLLDRPWNMSTAHLPRASYAQVAADPHAFLR
jgi:hypothetical protein